MPIFLRIQSDLKIEKSVFEAPFFVSNLGFEEWYHWSIEIGLKIQNSPFLNSKNYLIEQNPERATQQDENVDRRWEIAQFRDVYLKLKRNKNQSTLTIFLKFYLSNREDIELFAGDLAQLSHSLDGLSEKIILNILVF